ncbi:hypothetical protein GCM10025869_18370 [Homoserinibacter gongjuensis]|uniref:Fe-S cluster assembly iron-binding protein IscA n=2 Tax=Homoserinibacter gongjuensis TaxID=1162968 RepID=A0ABQ6JVA2_9MICO|nr:hypothetical protein GCM10025869_18370 [Homoserinibacter gongjuensis]
MPGLQAVRILGIVADSERPMERGTAMLTLTENAGTVVSDLVARASETDTAGLRIQQGENRFDIAIAEAPAPSEVVVERAGARVFMDAPVAQVLDEMTLDAVITPEGEIRFALAPQL